MEIALHLTSLLAAIVALFLIWWQLRHQSKHMKFEALTDLHKQLIKPSMKRTLRYLYAQKAEDLIKPPAEDREKIELVLNTYSLIGFRIKQGVLPKAAVLETEWRVILLLWQQLAGFISRETIRRKEPYKAYFEFLRDSAEAFRIRNRFPQPVVLPPE